MVGVHSKEWFKKQEAKLQEPINNTIRYYSKSATIKIASIILAPWGIVELIGVRRNLRSFSNLTTDYMNKGRAVTNDGAPGAGKTFTGSNVAYFLALEQWQRLKSDYFTQRTLVAQWVREGNTDKIEAFKALEESYNFYKENEALYIPCLASSIPLREYGTGRFSYKLTNEMFLQEEKTPEYTVYFNDESGLLQGANTSKTAPQDVLAFWRFPRHFFDGMFVNTNQDGAQNAIYMRRSTDFVNHIYGQEWIMSPTRLNLKYERKERKYFRRLERGKLSAKKAEYIGQELYYLKKYKATIGFRSIRCQTMTTEGVSLGGVDEIILPAIGGVEYDDRAYRKLYKCKDKPIELQGWDKLVVDEQATPLDDGQNDEAKPQKNRGGK